MAETLGMIYGITYSVGIVVTWIALYNRAGFPAIAPNWREFLASNPGFFVLMATKMFFWPATLGIWLASGRGPSAWEAVTQIDGREVRRLQRTG
jgi:hypothetical protein